MKSPHTAKKSSVRTRFIGALAATLVLIGAFIYRQLVRSDIDTGGQQNQPGVTGADDSRSPAVAAKKAGIPDFSHLPPAERINAETRYRMEQSAIWREKLRTGNYSSLPAEAYPSSVPVHGSVSR